MAFTENELQIIINGYERQASRLFKTLLFLLCTNLLFVCLYFFTPTPINIDLAQNKTNHSTQLVNR